MAIRPGDLNNSRSCNYMKRGNLLLTYRGMFVSCSVTSLLTLDGGQPSGSPRPVDSRKKTGAIGSKVLNYKNCSVDVSRHAGDDDTEGCRRAYHNNVVTDHSLFYERLATGCQMHHYDKQLPP
jgi:hypothetical protein